MSEWAKTIEAQATKERYEKPVMVTEKVDVATFVGQGSGGGDHHGPIFGLTGFIHLCCRG
jgi:hypothetical protein